MTLTDLLDRRKLAKFLDRPYETSDDQYKFDSYWSSYKSILREDWKRSKHNQFKPLSYTQFLAECLSKGLGLKRGTVAERIQTAMDLRSDLYTREEKPKPQITYLHGKKP